jgi:hypothetical protein
MIDDPCNVFALANTKSNGDAYQEHCRKEDIAPYPARMPSRLVEFFGLNRREVSFTDSCLDSSLTGINRSKGPVAFVENDLVLDLGTAEDDLMLRCGSQSLLIGWVKR